MNKGNKGERLKRQENVIPHRTGLMNLSILRILHNHSQFKQEGTLAVCGEQDGKF